MQEVQINTEYQDIKIKYYHFKNTMILKGVVVFFIRHRSTYISNIFLMLVFLLNTYLLFSY